MCRLDGCQRWDFWAGGTLQPHLSSLTGIFMAKTLQSLVNFRNPVFSSSYSTTSSRSFDNSTNSRSLSGCLTESLFVRLWLFTTLPLCTCQIAFSSPVQPAPSDLPPPSTSFFPQHHGESRLQLLRSKALECSLSFLTSITQIHFMLCYVMLHVNTHVYP